MTKKISVRLCLTACLLAAAFHVFSQRTSEKELQVLADNVFHLSEVMLHDVANPPAASRFYAYSMLGAYEAALFAKGGMPDISKQFKVDPEFKRISPPEHCNIWFCANYAMLDVGRQIMPSGPILKQNQTDLINAFLKSKGLTKNTVDANVQYAQAVANMVMAYARTDDYNKLSTYSRYTPKKMAGYWFPTPPEFMGAVEPQWKTIRSFFLDSASQFAPTPPEPFSTDTTSRFHHLMKEVYVTGKNVSDEQRKIAAFWDCNPFAVTYAGHMAIGLKKISPGGHWMGITGIVCKKARVSLDSALLIHTMVAITLHDAFISCWQEKYRSDRIRPESAINRSIDPTWRPLLQTPPFPEYTSGHSVASSSVSEILTRLLGDNFSFTDNSEVYFGLPERKFTSFYQAAHEAAISRLYGGIHFRDACDEGVKQGKKVGSWALEKLGRTTTP